MPVFLVAVVRFFVPEKCRAPIAMPWKALVMDSNLAWTVAPPAAP